MPLDLARLRVFYEVARCGGFTAAAARLHVTQSAVSHAMRKFEDDLGFPVVAWRGKRFELTGEGRQLLDVAARVFADLDEAAAKLAAGGSTLPDVVTIGATVEFGTTVLVQKLAPLLASNPGLRLNFRFANELNQMLLRNEIDLAVDCVPHTAPSVQRLRMFREKYVAVAAPTFLARNPVRTPRDLGNVPVLSLDAEGAWWRHRLKVLPAARRPALHHIVQIDHVRGLINATCAGYGVSLVPKYAVLAELARGALVVLFPRLRLLEDEFCIYQKRAHAGRAGNRLVSDFLLTIEVTEFGDAISGAADRRG